MKVAGQNDIFPPQSIIMALNKKKIPLIIYLSRETMNVANKIQNKLTNFSLGSKINAI